MYSYVCSRVLYGNCTWTDQPSEREHTAEKKGVVNRDKGCVPRGRRQVTSWQRTSFATHLLVDLGRELVSVAKVGDGSRCLFLRAWVIPDPRRGASTDDGYIWEAGEVCGGHQMGMRCRCGVLAMSL